MQGYILSAASSGSQGVILGDDGVRYTFTPHGWQGYPAQAVAGLRVDFEERGFHAVGIYPVPGAAPMQPPPAITTTPVQPAAPWTPIQPPHVLPTPHPQHPHTQTPAVSAPPAQYPHAQSPAAPPQQPLQATTESESRSKVLVWSLMAVVVVGIVAAGVFYMLQARQSPEEIAEAVAREWVSSSIDDVSELAMGYLVGNIPVVTRMGGDWLSDKIRENVTWTYSAPNCREDGRCDVTATARADLNINIPLVMSETATIAVPFHLNIDTDRERVANWSADIRSASVSGVELGSVGQGVGQIFESSDADIYRALEKVQEFPLDDDLEIPGVELIQFSDDISAEVERAMEDFDIDRAMSDFSIEADRVMEDFDIDQFSDIGDEVDRTLEDLDVDFGNASDDIGSAFDSLFGD